MLSQNWPFRTREGSILGRHQSKRRFSPTSFPIARFPERFFRARTTFSSRKQALDFLFKEAKSTKREVWRGLVINNSTIYSFYDLSTTEWKQLAESGTVESDLTFEWSMTADPDRKRLFVELLNETLQDQLREDDIHFSNMDKFYFHRASDDMSDHSRRYRSRRKNASREGFKRYSYARHAGCFAGKRARGPNGTREPSFSATGAR
jgi:hypothetical protein